jgi:hypothetical protein
MFLIHFYDAIGSQTLDLHSYDIKYRNTRFYTTIGGIFNIISW